MTWTVADVPDLHGKTIVITGANSGLGYEAARGLAKNGAQVVLACRSVGKAEAAAQQIRDEHAHAQLQVMALDLASLGSVRAFVHQFERQHARLHVLINNAGVMAIPRALSEDGFELQLSVNHLGHFALTGLLLGRLLATPDARVVNLTSLVSRIGRIHFDDLDGAQHYQKWTAYAQSKLANLLFSFELARRLRAAKQSLSSVACHPGYAATNLQQVGPTLEGSRMGQLIMKVGNGLLAQSAAAGAWSTLYAASAPDVSNGDFIGPQAFGQWRGAPGHSKAMRAAHDPETMRKLWEVSRQRTGVDYAALAA